MVAFKGLMQEDKPEPSVMVLDGNLCNILSEILQYLL